VIRIALAAAAAASLALAAAAQASTPTLQGQVGPGFSIEVKMGGKDVKTLKAGTYRLVVEDKASIHDFHLTGPGLNKVVTSVPFTGEKTVTGTLRKGKYTYQCDPHAASGMKGSFAVT
jgi:plastocyanin